MLSLLLLLVDLYPLFSLIFKQISDIYLMAALGKKEEKGEKEYPGCTSFLTYQTIFLLSI